MTQVRARSVKFKPFSCERYLKAKKVVGEVSVVDDGRVEALQGIDQSTPSVVIKMKKLLHQL